MTFRAPPDGKPLDGLPDAFRPRFALVTILVLALVLRLLWWHGVVGIIENEGAEYARLAESLKAGRGYLGMFGEIDPVFPPLYSALTALLSFLTGNVEVAARLVSLAAGLGLVYAMYRGTELVFGTPAGLLAALLTAVHPVLVGLSVSVFSEPLSGALGAAGTVGLLKAIATREARPARSAGVAFGLGGLARPELVAFAGLGSLATGLAARFGRESRRVVLRQTLLPVCLAFVITLPYAITLSRLVRRPMWEGKSSIIHSLNTRMRSGMSLGEASYGLGSDQVPDGPYLSPYQLEFLRQPPPVEERKLEAVLRHAPRLGKRALSGMWNAEYLGSPWLWIAALLGLVAGRWWVRSVLGGLLLLAFAGLQAATLLTVEYHFARYFFPLLPFAIPWAAAGLAVPVHALRRFAAVASSRWGNLAAVAIPAVLVLMLGAFALPSARQVHELHETRYTSGKEAGLRLGRLADSLGLKQPIIMGQFSAVTYYAGGIARLLPYADVPRVLEFIHRQPPAFIMVRKVENFPYAADWYRDGIPDRCAAPLFQVEDSTGGGVRAWRWTCGERETSTADP